MGEAGIPLPGPRCGALLCRDGAGAFRNPSVRPAPSPPTCSPSSGSPPVQPRKRGRGLETAEQAAARAKLDLALVAALSDAGLRRSEASSLTWGDVQRWDDGSGRITVIRSKTDVEAAGAVVAITPAAMRPWTPSVRWGLVER